MLIIAMSLIYSYKSQTIQKEGQDESKEIQRSVSKLEEAD